MWCVVHNQDEGGGLDNHNLSHMIPCDNDAYGDDHVPSYPINVIFML